MIEKLGGLTFKDGILVSDFDFEKEIEKRGGWPVMIENMLKHNALLRRLNDDTKRK